MPPKNPKTVSKPKGLPTIEPLTIKELTFLQDNNVPIRAAKESVIHNDLRMFEFTDIKHGKNFFIQGGRKVGKTTYLALLARECIRRKISFRFYKIDELVNLVTASWNNYAIRREYDSVIKRTAVIFIDGVGTETASKELVKKCLAQLLDYRYDEFKTTIVSSYIPQKHIREFYGDEISSFTDEYKAITINKAQ